MRKSKGNKNERSSSLRLSMHHTMCTSITNVWLIHQRLKKKVASLILMSDEMRSKNRIEQPQYKNSMMTKSKIEELNGEPTGIVTKDLMLNQREKSSAKREWETITFLWNFWFITELFPTNRLHTRIIRRSSEFPPSDLLLLNVFLVNTVKDMKG